jgi:ribonuclease HII
VPLIYAGIDEAGYGPLLGPLCVGMSVFHVEQWADGESAPDLWKQLSSAVCRDAGDKRRRIAVDDSKKLKLSNSSVSKHPLTHLERGVLTFLGVLEPATVPADGTPDGTQSTTCPCQDAEFFDRVGAGVPSETWYAVDAAPWPLATTSDAIGISVNTLRIAMEQTGVRALEMRCQAMGEGTFNELVQAAGTKAAATEAALIEHLWTIWDRYGAVGAEPNGGVRVICDRQGGRSYYAEMLCRAFPGVQVQETHHSETQSRYEMRGVGDDGVARHMHVLFLVESERQHLPVALASMLAKLTRESMMARFNRYWCARLPELKPTAGYRGDGWRWLEEAKGVVSASERFAMIRRA